MTKEEKKDEMKNRISMALKDPILQQGFEIICKNLAELEQTNNNLLDVINNQDVKIADLEQKLEQTEKDLADYQFNYPSIKELSKENEQLKKQIEKMKCCANCDHYRWSNGDDWCNDHYGQPMYDEECKGKWELRR